MTDIAGTSQHIVVVESAFDVRVLRDIVGDEPALLLEIVAYFDTVATGMRAGLLRAAADADAGGAAMLAHSLKSSARSVGALPLGVLCAELEEHGEAGRSDMVAPLVGDVVDAIDAALAAMRCWRGAQAPAAGQMTGYGS
ncbi:Hpt domain-containing protein [Luteimonas terricola]|uniref:HPt domain-containing protein n=1 Tax=Luteimonas terricola TaxID=645597 RepID=A0ABQ2EE34_9GAMM|nr:Hpt domain-containing protein [Luteimonas terricola]GGK07737.1 hypothetical protein GCM10011394_16230 [Luteimonas terricola]